MFVKPLTSQPYFALQLESIIQLQVVAGSAGGHIVSVRLVDGSVSSGGFFDTEAEAQAAFDVLLDHLGWTAL